MNLGNMAPAMDNLLAAVRVNPADGTIQLHYLDVSADRSLRVNNSSFVMSNYLGQSVVMDGTAKVLAVPTGARKVRIYNAGATTEVALIAPGTSIVDAGDNLNIDGTARATTGYVIPPVADASAAAVQELGLNEATTHIALCNAEAGHTQRLYVSFGG